MTKRAKFSRIRQLLSGVLIALGGTTLVAQNMRIRLKVPSKAHFVQLDTNMDGEVTAERNEGTMPRQTFFGLLDRRW